MCLFFFLSLLDAVWFPINFIDIVLNGLSMHFSHKELSCRQIIRAILVYCYTCVLHSLVLKCLHKEAIGMSVYDVSLKLTSQTDTDVLSWASWLLLCKQWDRFQQRWKGGDIFSFVWNSRACVEETNQGYCL